MGYLEAKAERNASLLRILHGIASEESAPQESEGKVDFDGGVREPAETKSPEEAHNEFVLKLFENTKLGGGGEW